MLSTLERMISVLPPTASILDVGAGGLQDENTGIYLKARFEDYTGINTKQFGQDILGDFYTHSFDRKFDLIVLDLNIDNNLLKDWTNEGLEYARSLLNPNGFLINYVMVTTNYGDPETPAMIAKHRDEFWNGWEGIIDKLENLKGFKLMGILQEERRPEILWVMLKTINGS